MNTMHGVFLRTRLISSVASIHRVEYMAQVGIEISEVAFCEPAGKWIKIVRTLSTMPCMQWHAMGVGADVLPHVFVICRALRDVES